MTIAMPWIRVFFLLAALTATSGFKFRCWIFCIDQTSVQNDYVDERDRCREYAQLKLDMAMRDTPGDEKTRKAKLVSLFSECMGNNGWSVPDGKGDKKPDAAAAAAAAPPPSPATAQPTLPAQQGTTPVAVAATAPDNKAHLSRSAECAFARHAAANSSNAAARAAACDLECANRLKAAPDAPRPAACPSEPGEDLSKGADTE